MLWRVKMKKISIILIIIVIIIAACTGLYFLVKNNKLITNKIKIVNTDSDISAVIVPHHDLVKEDRAKIFKELSEKTKPKTIILLSPNHFSVGNGNFITTDKVWELVDVSIEPDKEKIQAIAKTGLVNLNEAAFDREHGITNILGDINTNFPEAKIIPIMLRQDASEEEVNKLFETVNNVCKNDCLLIASVDCSHYQPGALAEIHDSLTIRALNNLDEDLIWQAEVDSPQSLFFALKWAKSHNADKFELKENTNSGQIANERDAESTSYIFGYYEQGEEKKIDDEITFMLGGDMMFDRYVDYSFREEKIFDVMKNLGERFFWGTDIAMVNLEGPISATAITPDNTANNLIFNFPPKTPDVLDWLHINAVSLANNHTNNAGSSGLENTKKMLGEKNITYIGQQSELNDNSVRRFQSGNQKISVITINLLETEDELIPIIQKEKQDGNFVVIFSHWGNEYEKTHSQSQEKTAHSWIDAGADLIIGSHPHVVQDAEIYQSKVIFYSLGNLLFDQMFSSETQRGLVLAGRVRNNQLEEIVILPTVQKNLKPQLLSGSEKTDLITKFRKNLGLEKENKDYGYDMIEIKR